MGQMNFFVSSPCIKCCVCAILQFNKRVIPLCLLKTPEFKNVLLIKKNANHQLSFSASCNLFCWWGTCLNDGDCRLSRVVAAERWGGCDKFLE